MCVSVCVCVCLGLRWGPSAGYGLVYWSQFLFLFYFFSDYKGTSNRIKQGQKILMGSALLTSQGLVVSGWPVVGAMCASPMDYCFIK